MSHFVYALYDVREPEHVRYIGATKQVERRLSDHISESVDESIRAAHKGYWIRKVIREGSSIILRVIETHHDDDAMYTSEQWWIAHLRDTGHRLTNVTDGGEGWRFNPWENPLIREKLMAARRERYVSDEFKEQTTEHWQQYWSSGDNRTQQADRVKKHFESSENRAVQSSKQKKLWEDPKYRADQSLKVNIGVSKSRAKRNGWMLELL